MAPFPVVKGLGKAAEAVADNLARLINNAEAESSSLGSLAVNHASINKLLLAYNMASSPDQLATLRQSQDMVQQHIDTACHVSQTLQLRVMFFACAGPSAIDEMIIFDREVDGISPMCTQLTYEGLLDEVLGIKNGTVSIEKEGNPISL